MEHISKAVQKSKSEWLWNPDASDEIELAFLARALIQITLPHSDPGDVPVWVRRNGDLMLILSRTNFDEETGQVVGFPFGTLPRLLLYWLNSEVVRTKSRRIELGHNLSQFMTELGLNPRNGRGERSDARRLRAQMDRLFSTSIRFKRTSTENGEHRKREAVAAIVEESDLWWDAQRPRQGYLWHSWIQLSETFYRTITASPVPLNLTALKTLKRSPLALDLYSWLCYRSWCVSRVGTIQRVSWPSIHGQFGSDYSDVQDFRKKALSALKKIVDTQPEIRVSVAPGGLEIRPSKAVISAK